VGLEKKNERDGDSRSTEREREKTNGEGKKLQGLREIGRGGHGNLKSHVVSKTVGFSGGKKESKVKLLGKGKRGTGKRVRGKGDFTHEGPGGRLREAEEVGREQVKRKNVFIVRRG